MKTFTKILTAAAVTALLATGCVNEDPAYKNNEPGTPPDPNAKGYLTLADMSMRVVVDTDTETRPDATSDETATPQTRTDAATPDVVSIVPPIHAPATSCTTCGSSKICGRIACANHGIR